MKPVLFIGAAAIAVLGVAAIAFAASGNDASGENAVDNQAPGLETPMPVEPDGGIGTTPDDKPMPVEPDGGIGTTPDDKPMPVEPDGGSGIGTTPDDKPMPVEPDGGIGTTPDDKPMPVEPDGGIGTTPPDAPVSAQDPPTPTQPVQPLPGDRFADPAPIDGVDVRIAESYPPQYFVHIQAGLPGGCAEKYTHSVTRNGNVIEIEVLNSMPVGNVACTMIYGMYDLNVPLGSGFVPGQVYTVSVNGGAATTQFTAQ